MSLVERLRIPVVSILCATAMAGCPDYKERETFITSSRVVHEGKTQRCSWIVSRQVFPRPGKVDVSIFYDAHVKCNGKTAHYFGSESYIKRIMAYVLERQELYVEHKRKKSSRKTGE